MQDPDPTAIITDEVKAKKESVLARSQVKAGPQNGRSASKMSSSVLLRAGKSTKKVKSGAFQQDDIGSIVTFGHQNGAPESLRSRQFMRETPGTALRS